MSAPDRVLELGEGSAVPFAGRSFAITGADVIKVELAPDGDWVRRRPPLVEVDGVNAGALFHYLNAGKRTVLIDEEQLEQHLDELWSWADAALIDERFLAVETVSDRVDKPGPDVVTCITPFGRSSEVDRPATPLTLFARSGEGNITPGGLGHQRFPDRSPLAPRGQMIGIDAGVIGTLVTLAALYHRDVSPNGDVPPTRPVVNDVSAYEVAVSNNRWIPSNFARTNWTEDRTSRPYPYGGLMPCKDGYCMFLPSSNGHWAALVEVMGRPDWALDPTFATYAGRAHNAQKLRAGLREWAATKTMEELFDLGLRHGVPIGNYRTVAEVAACPHLGDRGFFHPYGAGGVHRLPGLPAPGVADPEILERAVPGIKPDTHPNIEADSEVPTR